MRLPFPVKRSCSAFTLIELMVVLVIIAIMSALMVAEMSGNLQDALLRSSGRQLITVFNLASSRAISLNRLHRVRLDRFTGRYIIEKHSRGNTFVPADDVPGSEGKMDSRIAARIQDLAEAESPQSGGEAQPAEGAAEDAINFYPDGTADDSEVELRDRDGFGLALRVSPVTSRVQIIELGRQ